MAYTGQTPDTAVHRLDWQEQATCRDADPELFFNGRKEHEARTICVARCPVRSQCLAQVKEAERGMHRDHRHGVQAGLTGNERWRLDPEATRRKEDAPLLKLDGTETCGSYNALLRHLWLDERVDGVCWSGQTKRRHANQSLQPCADEPDPEPLAETPGPEPAERTAVDPEPAPVAAVEPPAQTAAPPQQANTPATRTAPPARGSTPHERRIYRLWASGLSDMEMARRMAISAPSVQRVRERLGLLPNLRLNKAS